MRASEWALRQRKHSCQCIGVYLRHFSHSYDLQQRTCRLCAAATDGGYICLQGLGEDKGLAGLFDRISNLGKGVVFGQSVGIVWMLRGYISDAVAFVFQYFMAAFVG